MLGTLRYYIDNLSQVVGGSTPETAKVMVELDRNVVKADLDPADPVTIEMVKMAKYDYRGVNIAFDNEPTLICEALDADV